MIKVSVILTTYNSEKFLQRTIDSVLTQEGKGDIFNLELVVIDDCSHDQTTDILKKNQIHFYSTNSNSGGPNRGRNIGLSKASGDYIIVMDHDDEWLPNRIITQLKYSQYAPIITCGYLVIENQSKQIPRVSVKNCVNGFIKYQKNETFCDKISRTKNKQITYMGSIMFHKRLKGIKFEEHFGQIDFDWIAHLFYNNESVEVCEILYKRYVDKSNLSLNKQYRIRDYFYSLLTLEEFLPEFRKEVKLGRKRINGTRARYHYLLEEMSEARVYFRRSSFNLKTILFWLTSFAGYKFVIKKFNFFG
ncbi:glycosyltransferase family 2 protein [Draconibacterium halophilum]|uniref:Glycosyltransferase family 2 protein n=1 Tax=Draconibacterium halophilum TaxID=2706887 RepID=A0A6C0R9U1_9BACT|nr:glycosyltransferase family 2 protein [Draconibacterium halophilum]QIA06722.1 glycosyltransferase family 2 protein [Draconibacterium halophilum]